MFLFIFSCSSEKEENIVASFKDNTLSIEEVYKHLIPNVVDTNIFVDEYINTWLKNQVMLDKAFIYISENDMEIERKVKEYKEELLIHKYQNELVNNEFDTTISYQEVIDYYNHYTHNFILNQNILKCKLIIFEKDVPNKKEIEKKIQAKTTSELDDLLNYCQLYANIYHLNDSNWVVISDVLQKLPENITIKKLVRSRNKIHSFTDEEFAYYLFVKDYQIKGNQSPLSFELSKIRNLLQNKKKIQYLEKIEDELYSNALSSGKIKIYK